jgi:hypothetical protein
MPKAVVYTHRSQYLHAMSVMMADGIGSQSPCKIDSISALTAIL